MKIVLKASAFATLAAALALPCLAHEPGREEANKEVVRKMIEAVNQRDLDALDALVTPDMVRHSAATAGVVVTNREQFKDFLRQDFAAVPDSRMDLRMIAAEGDLVAVYQTYFGTQMGAMGPFPASGGSLEVPFMGFLRLEDGLIAEMWVEWDNLHALTQLGHFPPPAASAPEAPADIGGVVAAFDAAWAARDPAAIAALMTPDAEYVEVATDRTFVGPPGVARYAAEIFAWAPDFTVRTIAVDAGAGTVVWEWVMEGTQTGDGPGLPATGKPFSVPGVSVLELRDGRIHRVRDYWDLKTLNRQLGVGGE
ncbi:MAG TPA: ester cyclase [Thermoanaerobaculia bacterium]|nr:ester cyclase [Thermoanaerobaculia bacterium]